MRYYSAIKNNEILPFATTRMDLENGLLSEISQAEEDKYFTYMKTQDSTYMRNLKQKNPRNKTENQIQRTN